MLFWLLPALTVAVVDADLRHKMMYTYARDANAPLFVSKAYPLFSKLNLSRDMVQESHSFGKVFKSTHENQETQATEVQAKVGLSGSEGAFSATVHSSFASLHDTQTHTMKSVRSYIFSKYQFNFVGHAVGHLWDYVAEEDQKNLLTALPNFVRETYGEFYNPTRTRYGGVFKSMFSREMSQTEDSTTVKADMEANYFTAGMTASGGTSSKKDTYQMATFFSMSAYGGDPSALGTTGNVDEVQEKWSAGIDDFTLWPTELYLRPIWEVLPPEHAERSKELATYFKAYWAKENKAVPKATAWAYRSCAGKPWASGTGTSMSKWCDDYSRRRRRNTSGWGIRTRYCPDGCRLEGKPAYMDWCNDNGGYHVCKATPPSQSNASGTEEEELPDITV